MIDRSAEPRPIAVMIGQIGQGGSERQLYTFLAHCDRKRWAPVLYVSSDVGDLASWRAPIGALGVPIVQLRGRRHAKMLQFRAACIAQGAKSFFSWSSYTNGFGLALLGLGVHRVGSFRNATFSDLPTRFRGLWARLSLAGVTTVVCNSRETQAELSRIAGAAKNVVYVSNAVQTFSPEQIAAWRSKWRAELGVSPADILIVGVGRLAPQKNFARFIEVIAQSSKAIPVKAVVIGRDDGLLQGLLEKVAQHNLQDVLRFVGPVADAREATCAADIFLLSSDFEGMPNVVLEAMAAGAPCVSTRVNGVIDLIEDGVTGFVATDTSELSSRVVQLARDPDLRHAMGARSLNAIERRRPEKIIPHLWALCEPPVTARSASTGVPSADTPSR